MSHLKIPRKQSHSPRNKIHSEQSKYIKYSVQRIVHENLLRRRFTTHNNSSQKIDGDNLKDQNRSKSKNSNLRLINTSMKNQIEEAKKAFKTKNTQKALPLFKKVYQKYPDVPDIPYYIGSCLLNQKKLAAALTYFNTTLQLDSNYDKNIYLYMAVCYKGLNKMSEAVHILSEASQKYPRFEEAHFYKAKMHIKLGQFNEAILTLKRCLLLNNTNQLAYILLGDCSRKIGKTQQALENYNKALEVVGQYQKTAYIHKLNILVELEDSQTIKFVIEEIKLNSINFPQLSFFQGILQYKAGKFAEATILFEMGLKQNLQKEYVIKIIKFMMQISIIEKDCFGAEHLVNRARGLKIEDPQILLYYDLIEGINDLIKRKVPESEKKLLNVYQASQKNKNYSFLKEYTLPYYGYCRFIQDKMKQSLKLFNQYIDMPIKTPKKLIQIYNKNICQGILFHKSKVYNQAKHKFSQSSAIFPDRIQPIFLECINQVQKMKQNRLNVKQVTQYLEEIKKMFKKAENAVPHHSLFLFYQSLVRLFENKDACYTIQMAIKYADEDVAEYFFINALAHSLKGQIYKGLEFMNKAIQTDSNITQFYKERSKYLYLLERYDQSCDDILKAILENPDDQQAKLLLAFYYYLTDQYISSLQLIQQLTNTQRKNPSNQHIFFQFQQALNFRLGNYNCCGIIGNLISYIINKKPIPHNQLSQILQTVNSRSCYCQFNVYFMYLLVAAYYLYVEIHQQQSQINIVFTKFDTAIDCLFGALEQINYRADKNYANNSSMNNYNELKKINQEQYTPSVEIMLNQVKFNIVIANLLRLSFQQQPEDTENLLHQTLKFIKVFITETEDLQFIEIMKNLFDFINKQNPKQQKMQHIISFDSNTKKVSQQFPNLQIKILPNKTIIAKILIFYPQKLKFNISPEFDQSFLFNFDIDKIQAKLCPPWYKMENQRLVFTDKVRNQSVLLSQTDKSYTPLLRAPSPIEVSLRDKFKLDQSVERKLNKIIKR